MKWWILLLAALAAILIACGGDKSEAEIRDTIEGFYQAINSDPPKAYTYLAQECKDEINFIEFATGLTFFDPYVSSPDWEPSRHAGLSSQVGRDATTT